MAPSSPSRYGVKTLFFLSVDPPADGRIHARPFLIEAPCCETLNPVLLESDMHPDLENSPLQTKFADYS